MATHKFTVGQTVRLVAIHNRVKAGVCEIIRLRPLERGHEPGYLIKMAGEPYERVAAESELEGEA
jgi:hypothetical protein